MIVCGQSHSLGGDASAASGVTPPSTAPNVPAKSADRAFCLARNDGSMFCCCHIDDGFQAVDASRVACCIAIPRRWSRQFTNGGRQCPGVPCRCCKASGPTALRTPNLRATPTSILAFDRDAKFGAEVVSAVRDTGSQPTRTAFRSPNLNGVAERWVGGCRRDLLDHVIILNERHLKRPMSSYLLYYHEDRTRLGLSKDTPAGRPTEICPECGRKIQSFPGLGWLHHRYAVEADTQEDSRAILLKIKLFLLNPA